MARNNQRGRNNNPEGRNQYSSSGLVGAAKERPLTAAAAVGAAAAAGVFLWSKRDKVSEQLGQMNERFSDWSSRRGDKSADGKSTSSMRAESGELEMAGAGTAARGSMSRATGGRSGKAQGKANTSPARSATPAM